MEKNREEGQIENLYRSEGFEAPQRRRSFTRFRRDSEPKPKFSLFNLLRRTGSHSHIKTSPRGKNKKKGDNQIESNKLNEEKTIIISKVEDLPKNELNQISGIDHEQLNSHLELVCSIITFLGPNKVITQKTHERHQRRKERQERKKQREKELEEKKELEKEFSSVPRLDEENSIQLLATSSDQKDNQDKEENNVSTTHDEKKEKEKDQEKEKETEKEREIEKEIEKEKKTENKETEKEPHIFKPITSSHSSPILPLRHEINGNKSKEIEIDDEDEDEGNEKSNKNGEIHSTEFSVENLISIGTKELIEQDPKKIYKVVNTSGRGGFGTVFQVKDKKGNTLAMKRMTHHIEKRKRSNLKEIGALKLLDHPNIVSYHSTFLWDNEVCLFTEFLEGGTLSEAVKLTIFTESQIAYVCREMLKALDYLHSKQLIHKDLKSANVMMSITAQIKLIDLGLISECVTGKQKGCGGSPYWMSPEMIRMDGYDTKNDIWSFAICILELARIHHDGNNFKVMFEVATQGWADPFSNNRKTRSSTVTSKKSDDIPKSMKSSSSLETIHNNNVKNTSSTPTPSSTSTSTSASTSTSTSNSKWSNTFQTFISHCLSFEPSERWNAAQLLEHPFIELAAKKNTMESVLHTIFLHQALKAFG